VRIKEVEPLRHAERSPMPALFLLDGGRWAPDGCVTFSEKDRRRFIEAHLDRGWRLRFEVFEEHRLSAQPFGFAEIDVLDLSQHTVWRLMLSDPAAENAIYGEKKEPAESGDKTEPLLRRPSFIQLRTSGMDFSPVPTFFHPARQPSPVVVEDVPCPGHFPGCGWRRERIPGKKRVLIMTRGTRGDVQPFLALARGLAAEPFNCEVTFCTEIVWKQFVLDSRDGLPPHSLHFRPSGGNTIKQTQLPLTLRILKAGQHADSIQAVCLANSEQNFLSAEGCFFYWAWEEQPDFIVFGFTGTHIALIISEALQIPIVGFLLQPAHELEQRINPATVRDQLLGPVRQIIGTQEFNAALQQIMELVGDGGPTLNTLRLSRGLAPGPRGIQDDFLQYAELTAQNVPQIVPISPLALGSHAQALRERGLTPTDFIFLRRGMADSLDNDVSNFIHRARSERRQIVLMSFSSMPVGERKILQAAVEVCKHCMVSDKDGTKSRHPAFIAMVNNQEFDRVPAESALLSDIERMQSERKLLVVRSGVSFGALFPKIDAAVLHGGLGVTSEALLAGIPVITSGILLMDQRYWAARVAELGCGPPGICIDDLLLPSQGSTTAQIVGIVQQALDPNSGLDGKKTWSQRAKEIQQQLLNAATGELDGVALNATHVFEAGSRSSPVSDAYANYRGCLRSCARQMGCCRRCFAGCLNWLFCIQCPSCLLFQLKCISSILYCALVTFCCCRRREACALADTTQETQATSCAYSFSSFREAGQKSPRTFCPHSIDARPGTIDTSQLLSYDS
jgi:hypothetical protein